MAQYKAALLDADGTDTVKSSVFGPQWPDFNPMRVLRTPLVDEWQQRVDEIPRDTSALPAGSAAAVLRPDAGDASLRCLVPAEGTTGDAQDMPLLAGEGVGLVRAIEPAADVVRAMARDAVQALQALRVD